VLSIVGGDPPLHGLNMYARKSVIRKAALIQNRLGLVVVRQFDQTLDWGVDGDSATRQKLEITI
jgi:hypothetical protein